MKVARHHPDLARLNLTNSPIAFFSWCNPRKAPRCQRPSVCACASHAFALCPSKISAHPFGSTFCVCCSNTPFPAAIPSLSSHATKALTQPGSSSSGEVSLTDGLGADDWDSYVHSTRYH
ncbi:hypothetical protein CGRA01v4_06984 [Colletotrichum graminicola]|nr:hypothetical protein CGRA01v4_06984 [Colletotrichum graminicola]